MEQCAHSNNTKEKRPLPYILLILVLLSIDQAIKIWVKTHMAIGDEFIVFDWFRILFVENPGMAYGIELGSKLFLTLFRVIAMCFALFVLLKSIADKRLSTFFCITLAIIIAGGVGNVVDCIFYGQLFGSSQGTITNFLPKEGGYAPWFMGNVVDMFYFPIINSTYPSWIPFVGGTRFVFFSPVFNFADSCISVGVIALFLFHSHSVAYALELGFTSIKESVKGLAKRTRTK